MTVIVLEDPLEDPLESIFSLMDLLNLYDLVSGLKINVQKTSMLIKNMTTVQASELQHITGFSLSAKVKYLGIVRAL